MKHQQTVVLYGGSLLMAGVEASLKGRSGLDIVRLDASAPNAAQRLKALAPDVVIFNLDAPHAQFVIPLLTEHPGGLSLIGLMINSNTAVVFSSQPYTVQAANDLIQMIQTRSGSPGQVN